MSNMSDLLARQQVRQSVRDCKACALHLACRAPVPFTGPAPCNIAIIGEAPGKQEDAQGKPFVGPAGQLARELMFKAHIDPNKVAFLNMVSCYPGRTPNDDEIKACEWNLLSQLEIIKPKWVLCFGKIASGYLGIRDDLTIAQIRGQWFRVRNPLFGLDSWCIVTYHPAAWLRSKDPKIRYMIQADLEALKFYSVGVFEPEKAQWCVKCPRVENGLGTLAELWEDGVGYCKKHAGSRRIRKWQRAKQERMFI